MTKWAHQIVGYKWAQKEIKQNKRKERDRKKRKLKRNKKR